jgi:predicted  nucleic acid-binding Zn-ribbon protein
MKRVADGLIQANEGIKQMADAVLDARDEHEDLKETIARLEGLIVAQGEDLRALRRRIEGTDH